MCEFKVRVTGCRTGANKVEANHTIRESQDIGLAEAKRIVDRILDGETVSFEVHSESKAQHLAASLQELNFDASVEKR